MTDLQFKLTRLFMFPLAFVLLVNWLFTSSSLSLQKSVEVNARVSFAVVKRHEVVYLHGQGIGEVRISCLNVRQLCERGIVPVDAEVKVWLQDPNPLGDRWVVRALLKDKEVVSVEAQAKAYSESKIMWTLGTLAAVVVAFVLWYFAPFGKARRDEA